MPEHIPTSAEKKCPVCGSATVYEVPAGGGLWSCGQCRNLVPARRDV